MRALNVVGQRKHLKATYKVTFDPKFPKYLPSDIWCYCILEGSRRHWQRRAIMSGRMRGRVTGLCSQSPGGVKLREHHLTNDEFLVLHELTPKLPTGSMVTAAWYSVLMEEETRVPGDCACRARNTEWAAVFLAPAGPARTWQSAPCQPERHRRVLSAGSASGPAGAGHGTRSAQLGPESRRLNGPMAVATGLLGRPFESACRKCRSLGFILRAQVFRVGSRGPLRTSSVRRERGELASLDALPRS
jgi:hypothetical protein